MIDFLVLRIFLIFCCVWEPKRRNDVFVRLQTIHHTQKKGAKKESQNSNSMKHEQKQPSSKCSTQFHFFYSGFFWKFQSFGGFFFSFFWVQFWPAHVQFLLPDSPGYCHLPEQLKPSTGPFVLWHLFGDWLWEKTWIHFAPSVDSQCTRDPSQPRPPKGVVFLTPPLSNTPHQL